jgi:hypothetical protein
MRSTLSIYGANKIQAGSLCYFTPFRRRCGFGKSTSGCLGETASQGPQSSTDSRLRPPNGEQRTPPEPLTRSKIRKSEDDCESKAISDKRERVLTRRTPNPERGTPDAKPPRKRRFFRAQNTLAQRILGTYIRCLQLRQLGSRGREIPNPMLQGQTGNEFRVGTEVAKRGRL